MAQSHDETDGLLGDTGRVQFLSSSVLDSATGEIPIVEAETDSRGEASGDTWGEA
jgi:hypothetical protein